LTKKIHPTVGAVKLVPSLQLICNATKQTTESAVHRDIY